MRPTRTAEQALRLASSQQYICQSCRSRAIRQFSSSTSRAAEIPFYKRIQNTLFGTKESDLATQSREEKQKKRFEAAAKREEDDLGLETVKDKQGNEYEVAAFVDPTTNKDYVVATNSDGLESVGSVQWVKERADQGEVYYGFAPAKRTELSNRQWELLLHHVMVEILALQKAGRGLEEICYPRADGKNWLHTHNTTVIDNEDGDATLRFANDEAEQAILASISQSAPEQEQDNSAALFQEVIDTVSEGKLLQESEKPSFLAPDWMNISTKDPELKMAIIKRTLQLTGKRLPDPVISTSSTLGDLYNGYKTKEKPKKLAQTPQMQKLKVSVPNVSVHFRRQTPIDKEQQIGRWKIIEEELIRRDLPVTGSRWPSGKARVD